MTRGQVARRLGKSLATVRRLEGILLHPERDARGVHHFDEIEVDALADRIADGDVAVWKRLRGSDDTGNEIPLGSGACPHCAEAASKLQAMRDELLEQQSRFGVDWPRSRVIRTTRRRAFGPSVLSSSETFVTSSLRSKARDGRSRLHRLDEP